LKGSYAKISFFVFDVFLFIAFKSGFAYQHFKVAVYCTEAKPKGIAEIFDD